MFWVFLDDQLLTGVERQHRDVYESERNVSYLRVLGEWGTVGHAEGRMEGVLRGQDGLCKPEACGDFTGVFESHWVTVKVDKRGTCCGRDQPYHTGVPGTWVGYSCPICEDDKVSGKYEV